jgi:hypothetical protein
MRLKRSTEQLFYDNVKYNAMLAKDKQEHKMRWPVCYSLRGEVHMLKSEVIKKLAEWGIEINSPNTLKNWEDWGLIPQASFRNSRTTEYPDETAAEAFASEKLRKGEYKVNKEKARQIREKALGFEKKDGMGGLTLLLGKQPPSVDNMLAIQWIKDRDKMLQGFNSDGEVFYKFHSESFTRLKRSNRKRI